MGKDSVYCLHRERPNPPVIFHRSMNSVCDLTRGIAIGVAVCVFSGVLAAPGTAQTTSTKAKSQTQLLLLRERFGEQQFAPRDGYVLRVGQRLPPLVWENPDTVRSIVAEADIPTRWFNESFDEVEVAERPGRYYAYGEAPTPSGPPLRRAMTCCCPPEGVDLEALASKHLQTLETSTRLRERDSKLVAEVRQRWRSSEAGAVELAALLDPNDDRSSVRLGQWQMENATRHVRLKRKLMGWDKKPLRKPVMRPVLGPPAPVLRKASLEQAEITPEQAAAIEAKMDAWFADSQEPMAIVIARNGVIVAARGYGQLDEEPVTIDTPMLLHSAMKPLIGMQLATYVDQGILRLDEPIGKYLPDFDRPSDQRLTFRAGHIHATGIHFPWELAFRRLFYFHTWHESLIAHCKREWPPGAKRRYGVVGVILSVRALELVRGRNYWDAMERDLFHPLGIRNVLPGGTGVSAEGMARLGVVMANRGKYGNKEVFSEATYDAIIPIPLEPYFPALKSKYGIGFQVHSNHLGPGSFGHGGGCGTLLSINPDKHLVFAMVRNDRGKNYGRHLSELTALLRSWINP